MHWVNTLRGQFVTVVALAVILSSVTVIAILEIARQGELRRVRSGAIIERVANSFELIAELDPQQREAATQAITSNFYHYEILQTDPLQAHVMSDEESTMALSVKASQENQTLALIRVRFPPDMDVRRRGEGGDNGRSRRGNGNNDGDNDRRRSRDRDRDDDDDNRRRSRDRDDDDDDDNNRRRNRVRGGDNDEERLRLRIGEDDRIEISQAIGPSSWITVRFEAPENEPFALDMLFAALLAAILTSVAAAWLAGRVSRPISALAGAADEVARGKRPTHLEPHGPDDIRRATEAFNTMAERVSQTLDTHRQLLSAVGHDLRTPLAAMRITSEFVKDEDIQGRLVRNLDELQSLTETVLAAVQSNGDKEMTRVDLVALVDSLCEDLIELSQPVEVSLEGIAPYLCRSANIRRALRNLIENAVRYGKTAKVSLETTTQEYKIIIIDEGPGIPEGRINDVFEAFVRLEESRSTITGGAGLGLTLARTAAREHGGDVELKNISGGGLQATLRLPRDQEGS
jgi:signal transduction histidine kinase